MIDHVRLFAAEFWPTLSGREGPLARLLREDALYPVFQPVVDLKTAAVHAHEALIRGPAGSWLQSGTAANVVQPLALAA
ncbi:MAG: hypothetical protein K2Y15_01800 [Burkholderiaceae bacterium]|nr:hypothetical protein [Burkholderiaceae bacterium]